MLITYFQFPNQIRYCVGPSFYVRMPSFLRLKSLFPAIADCSNYPSASVFSAWVSLLTLPHFLWKLVLWTGEWDRRKDWMLSHGFFPTPHPTPHLFSLPQQIQSKETINTPVSFGYNPRASSQRSTFELLSVYSRGPLQRSSFFYKERLSEVSSEM